MSSGIKKTLIALSISSALVAPSAFATNGYFAHGYSTAEKGLAGAGVAYSQDSLASATNPAGMVKVGERMDVGAALFNPNRQYTVTGTSSFNPAPGNPGCPGNDCFPLETGTFESDSDLFLIPHFGYNWMLDDKTSFGIAAYGNGGMNTDYSSSVPSPLDGFLPPAGGAASGTFGAGKAGVNLEQLFINASYAKQINDKHAVGASLIFGYQTFKATGLGLFAGKSNDATNLTDNGKDSSTGFGVKLGWQGDVAKDVTVGVSYQSQMQMSEFDDYSGLFAEEGDFDIPATATIGMAWKTSDRSTLVVDLQKIYYSDVASIANSVENLFVCSVAGAPDPTCLGGSNGGGFGWDDMTVIKLGYEWEQNDMIWRVGLSNGDQPIQGGGETSPPPNGSEVLFNILAPAVMETHVTFGFTMPLDSSSEFTFAGMYAPNNSVKGSSQFDSQVVEIEMDQFEVQGTYTMKF